MKIHCIIHESFEGIGCIKDWIALKKHKVSFTLVFNNEKFPNPADIDWLIIMGGGMSVYEEDKYPQLTQEKEFIRKCIDTKKTILGICLGSQFLADSLGAKVYPAKEKEIGWFPVLLYKNNLPVPLKSLPGSLMAFHWHGDTFDIPKNAVGFASSELTPNQGFFYDENILALQYHYEVDEYAVRKMVQNAEKELSEKGRFIQSSEKIIEGIRYVKENNSIMFRMLDYLESKTKI